MNDAWYISRAAGFAAYILLFGVVALGLAIHTRASDRLFARWRVNDIHEFGSLLALAFLGLHAGVLLADTYVGYSIWQILIPFAAPTRAAWTGVGVITGYLLVLVVASFYVRRWIGYRTWRLLHYSTFGLYVMATLHGVFTGTDSVTAWAQLLYISTGGIVVALILYRAVVSTRRKRGAAHEPVHVPIRALSWGAAALGITAVVALASGLGPFHWFEGSGSTTATAPLNVQANSASGGLIAPAGQAESESEHEGSESDDDHASSASDPSSVSADGGSNHHDRSHDSHGDDGHEHDDD
jgi:hypothetical protein